MRNVDRNLLGALALALVASCAGGDDGPDAEAALTVAITDAATDELSSFTVDITSIELEAVGGAMVGILAQPVNVDLVTLTDTSQILNVLNVPAGFYTGASITIDFAGAQVFLVGETTAATILDGDGAALNGSVTLPITIGNILQAIIGRNRVLELDFDLNQSVEVDALANAVMIEPAIVMRVDRTDPRELFVGGELLGVDFELGTFDVELQTLAGNPITTVAARHGSGTVYQIDGVPTTGLAGLVALDGMTGTWVQIYGAIQPALAQIEVDYVEAGVGTFNGGTDIVDGVVVGRTGGAGADATLMVLGHGQDATHTAFQFNTAFTVSTSFANTTVVRRGAAVTTDTDELNIGQRVRMFGALTGTALDASTMGSVVRVRQTDVYGFANGAPAAGVLDLDLVRVELRDEAAFTWTEGGTSPADPDALLAAVGGLTTGLDIDTGVAVRMRGFFSAVDDDDEDFVASSVTNLDDGASLLLVRDRAAGFTVTPTFASTGIELAITGVEGANETAILDRGFVGSTPLPTTPNPLITPAGPFGLYSLRDRVTGTVQLFLVFEQFTAALDTAVGGGAVLFQIAAVGEYDGPNNELFAGIVTALLD